MAQVSKWGNSLAVRIPSDIVKAMGLREGDELSFGVSEAGREFVGRKETTVSAAEEREVWLQRLAELQAEVNAPRDFTFTRDEASGWDRFDKWGSDRPESDR